MTWLVTGGAGYIGAHVVRAFLDQGIGVVVLDDLSSGHAGFVPDGVPFVRGSILDRDLVSSTLCEYAVTGVVASRTTRSTLPPVAAAMSTMTEPGRMATTIEAVISRGAGRPGMRAVVMTMSLWGTFSAYIRAAASS